MKEEILGKVINVDGSLVWKYSKTSCVQKYFTEEEILYLKNNCFGDTYSEKYYCLKNNIVEAPKCVCGKPLKFLSFKAGYQHYCSNSCTLINREYKEEWKEKRAKTNLERYGVENTLSLVDDNKRRQSLLDKYGAETPFGDKKIQDKALETKKKNDTYKNMFNKIKDKYDGIGNGSKEISEKIKQTNLERYGEDNFMKTEEGRKIAKTNLENRNYNLRNRGKYFYKGISFDSSWELAYYIYNIANNIKIERNTEKYFMYFDSKNKVHKYYPDFIINDNTYVEIKGNYLMNHAFKGEDFWPYKEAIIKNNDIVLITKEEIEKYLIFVYKKYNKNYLKQFKVKKDEDFKRDILEIKSEEEIKSKVFEKRNSNIKIKITCSICNRIDYQAPKIVLHFNNLICKSCRRKNK